MLRKSRQTAVETIEIGEFDGSSTGFHHPIALAGALQKLFPLFTILREQNLAKVSFA